MIYNAPLNSLLQHLICVPACITSLVTAMSEDVQNVHIVGLRIQTRQQQGSNEQKGKANIPFIGQAGNHNEQHHDAKNGSHCNIAEKNTFKQFYLHFGFSRNQSPHLDSPPWITGCLVIGYKLGLCSGRIPQVIGFTDSEAGAVV